MIPFSKNQKTNEESEDKQMKSITINNQEIPYACERRDTPVRTGRKEVFSSYNQLPLALNANQVAAMLGISRAGAYNLMRSEGFPTLRVGNRMIVPKEKLLAWMNAQIGV